MVKFASNAIVAAAQKVSRQVALLGGTFDPFHNGHLRLAIELRLAGFDEIRLIPNAVPPHRPQPVASGELALPDRFPSRALVSLGNSARFRLFLDLPCMTHRLASKHAQRRQHTSHER